jgi:hypothetical protein
LGERRLCLRILLKEFLRKLGVMKRIKIIGVRTRTNGGFFWKW